MPLFFWGGGGGRGGREGGVTLNARGLKPNMKRLAMFRYLKQYHYVEGTAHGQGEIILISQKLNCEVNIIKQCSRLLVMHLKGEGIDVVIASVYAPNLKAEKKIFLDLMFETAQGHLRAMKKEEERKEKKERRNGLVTITTRRDKNNILKKEESEDQQQQQHPSTRRRQPEENGVTETKGREFTELTERAVKEVAVPDTKNHIAKKEVDMHATPLKSTKLIKRDRMI